MTQPIDQAQRTRFITELERNFSVVASAGSGKTRAITDRIIALAKSPQALERLPTLLVVTYTNRAAGEMQQRARQSLLEAGVSLDVLAAFNRAFFGTIHALCMKLLRQQGHHLGLPGRLDHLDDDSALWMEFVQQHTTIGAGLTPAQRTTLAQLAPVRNLMELGRHGSVSTGAEPGDFPALDFDAIYAFAGNKGSLNAVTRSQNALRRWHEEWAGGGFAPLPDCESKPLRPAWDAALGPVRDWVRRCSLKVAAEIADAYRVFRLTKGAINYDDQIALASALLRHPEAAHRIREKNYRVILDEAQDTDPTQFDLLLEIARPPAATGAWLETENAPPRPGHFCMVGDFQQSIFGDRADLAHYRRVHDLLLRTSAGEAVEFSVTFRLDQQQIDFINATFSSVLHGSAGQVDFVRLNPRPAVLPGQIIRLEFGELPDMTGWNEWRKAAFAARELATWLRAQGLEKLRAQSWRDVAVLCPRKGWFPVLRDALRAEGFQVQLQSERDLKGDSPAFAWFTALAVIMAEPRNGYEIVGVLREVFGLPDHELAAFAEGFGDRWQIAGPTAGTGLVIDTLNLLASTRAAILPLPLFSALQKAVQLTQLRDRLLALPGDEFGDLDTELDDLLTFAASAESDHQTLSVFADELRAGFSATREVRASRPDAVQLITTHKAKGSEWQAVVVPFFARGAKQRSRPYPRLLRDPRTGVMHAALEAADIGEDLKAATDAHARQELERLLYVALTRARHTLVLMHDHALFTNKTGLSKNAGAHLLGCGEPQQNFAAFTALRTETLACAVTALQQADHAAIRTHEQSILPLAPFASSTAAVARERATLFIKRNPSALAEAALADADPAAYLEMTRRAAAAPGAGLRYGTWWHEFVEDLDWRADAATWDAVFEKALDRSPDPALSHRQWALLRTQLTNGSEFANRITAGGAVAHAEMPFLWAMNERECLEGIIDLAIFDSTAGSWLIVDWKTNRTTPNELAQLSEHYLPQISAYWKALSEMLRAPITTGLYSTAVGAWLPYDTTALAKAWTQLTQEPAAMARALAED